jgi:nucleotide-binding universal stress UspA family protein
MYRKILVPMDDSDLAESVLPHVEKVAKESQTAEVVLLRVCEPPVVLADYPAPSDTHWEEHLKQETAHAQQQCKLYLIDAEQRLKKAGLSVSSASMLGSAPKEIVNYAMKNQVDLIIMASHGRSGIARWVFGSTAQKVRRASPIPVIIIKRGERLPSE